MLTAALLGAAPLAVSHAQTIAPAFTGYTFTDLGAVLGVPEPYGPINFALSGGAFDYNHLIVGGGANTTSGALYSVQVVRGAGNHITGFGGPSVFYAEAPFNDGGATYGPGNVLFLARWPHGGPPVEIGQIRPGSTTTDKVIDLVPFGLGEAAGGVTFVPSTHPGAGQLKYMTYVGSSFYTLGYAPDGTGLFDVTSATLETTLASGMEGFAYVPLGSSGFAVPSMLVAEFDSSLLDPANGYPSLAAYALDANGNPIVASRRLFMSGLYGAEGLIFDPLTGDLLVSTFGAAGFTPQTPSDHVVVIQGFATTATPEPATLALCGLGLAALVLRRLARRRLAA